MRINIPLLTSVEFNFMGNPHIIFLNALFGLQHVMPPHPPLWHPLWSDNSREVYNTIAKHRVGLGGQAQESM